MGPISSSHHTCLHTWHVLQHEPIIDEGEANVFPVLQLVKLHCLLQNVFMGDPRFIQQNHRLITFAKLDDVMFYDPPFCFHGSCKYFNTSMFVFVVVFRHLVPNVLLLWPFSIFGSWLMYKKLHQSWYSSLATISSPLFIWKLVRWSLKSILKVLLMPWMLAWCQKSCHESWCS